MSARGPGREPGAVERGCRSVLRRAVRGRAATGAEWGEALLAELAEARTAFAAVRWTVSSLPLARRERRRASHGARAGRRRRLVVSGVSFLFLVFLVNAFVATVFDQPSFALAPAVHANDRVLVDKVGYHLYGLHRGDIVLVHRPREYADGDALKRIVGLPGDRMSCTDGVLYRDGVPVPDLSPETGGACETVTIGSGQIYIVGDSGDLTADSRAFGPIPASAVVGRAVAVVWPLR